jgi:hypothetical protein
MAVPPSRNPPDPTRPSFADVGHLQGVTLLGVTVVSAMARVAGA